MKNKIFILIIAFSLSSFVGVPQSYSASAGAKAVKYKLVKSSDQGGIDLVNRGGNSYTIHINVVTPQARTCTYEGKGNITNGKIAFRENDNPALPPLIIDPAGKQITIGTQYDGILCGSRGSLGGTYVKK